MNFSIGVLQTLMKLVQIEILELVTCSAAGNGMLLCHKLKLLGA